MAVDGPLYPVNLRVQGRSWRVVVNAWVATESLDWQSAVDSGTLELIRKGHVREAKERLEACLLSSSD